MLAPVVFTSALNWASCSRREVRECFGQAVWIISQGPQVWLDAQVAELEGGLLVNWDAREEVFPPGVLDAMFCAYEKLIADLITDEDPWNRPVTSLLPDEQRQARASR